MPNVKAKTVADDHRMYVEEKASKVADAVYEKAEAGGLKLVFSIWNVGETIGVLDRYVLRRFISAEIFRAALSKFILESMKMIRLGQITEARTDENQ